MEILEIYKERKLLKIAKEFDEKKTEIKKADKYEIERRKACDKLDEIFKAENEGHSFYEKFDKMLCYANGKLVQKETKEKLEVLKADRENEENNLYELIDEVNAQIEIVPDYETKIAILKQYGILNKDGKISE